MTPVQKVFDRFFTYITDDMFMEISPEQTTAHLREYLGASIPLFEFPRCDLSIRVVEDTEKQIREEYLQSDLTDEEINIVAFGMVQIWLQNQITSVETVRQKFTGTDFKMTSQASHLQRLNALMQATKDEHRRMQMLYSRRTFIKGEARSTLSRLVTPARRRRMYWI